jgi:CDP-diacylglycerol--serine O-phosphatidyltransferase
VLPNLFTLAALFGGFYAIVMAMNNKFELAAVGVFCAMVLDSLDGRVARMTHTQSAFGEQMDSLSDMVSFGAAPALIAYEWALRPWGAGAGLPPLCIAPARHCAWRAST